MNAGESNHFSLEDVFAEIHNILHRPRIEPAETNHSLLSDSEADNTRALLSEEDMCAIVRACVNSRKQPMTADEAESLVVAAQRIRVSNILLQLAIEGKITIAGLTASGDISFLAPEG